jgi:exodeoxyribonuclease V alpha subunit
MKCVGTIIKEKNKGKGIVYMIETSDNEIIELIFFPNNNNKISHMFEIEFIYSPNNNPNFHSKIESYTYLKLIRKKKDMIRLLTSKADLLDTTSENIYNKFKDDSLKIILYDFNKISYIRGPDYKNAELKIRKDQYEKLKKFSSHNNENLIIKYLKMFSDYDMKCENKYISKLETKNNKNKLPSIIDIINDPYLLYEKCKLTFIFVDELAIKIDINNEKSGRRMECIILHIFRTNNKKEGQIYLTYDEIINFLNKDKTLPPNISVIFKNENMIDKLICVDRKHYRDPYYTSQKFYDMEKYIEKYLSNEEPIEYDDDIINEINNCDDLDELQKVAVVNIIKNRISIINGGPGTGKSHVIINSINFLTGCMILLAPTGAAVENIKSKINDGVECRTIHSFIYYYENNSRCGVQCIMNDTCFIIDEMSMVSMELFYDLLTVINLSRAKNIRLVLVGDYNQIPCIQGGNIFYDAVRYSDITKIKLKLQHRAENEIIINNARLILKDKDLIPDNDKLCVIYEEDINKINDIIINQIKKNDLCTVYNTCVISPTRKNKLGCTDINNLLQKYYTGNQKILFNLGYMNIKQRDILVFKKNNKELDIYNGTMLDAVDKCTIKITDDKDINVNTNTDTETEIEGLKCIRTYDSHVIDMKPDLFQHIQLGYSSTVHVAQGKGYDYVIIVMHSSMYSKLLYKGMLYTAITRAKKKCIIICDKKSLRECKKSNPNRVTFLFQ